LAIDGGQLELVAIARRPGVLSKVAIRPRGLAVPVVWAGIGADDLARVGALLDGERIEVVRWHRAATAYITAALGLGEDPPIVLLPGLGHARVLLGEIDVRGIAGWRGLNTVLASTLTGWRIRLEPLARTSAWRWLKAAMATRRPVAATVLGSGARGLRVEVHGLYAWLTSHEETLRRTTCRCV
jgi:transcription antitermination factor NusA-like protein